MGTLLKLSEPRFLHPERKTDTDDYFLALWPDGILQSRVEVAALPRGLRKPRIAQWLPRGHERSPEEPMGMRQVHKGKGKVPQTEESLEKGRGGMGGQEGSTC